jgi:hypothetical protein
MASSRGGRSVVTGRNGLTQTLGYRAFPGVTSFPATWLIRNLLLLLLLLLLAGS